MTKASITVSIWSPTYAGRAQHRYLPHRRQAGMMMKYADQRNAPRVIIIGSREAQSGEYSVKNMLTGEQETSSRKALVGK